MRRDKLKCVLRYRDVWGYLGASWGQRRALERYRKLHAVLTWRRGGYFGKEGVSCGEPPGITEQELVRFLPGHRFGAMFG